MLIEFFGENFGCFRDEFRLSMEATGIDPGDDHGVRTITLEDGTTIRLLRSAVIYGPNASGKSTVVRAVDALRFLVRISGQADESLPLFVYEPYALSRRSTQPSKLGVKFIAGGIPLVYQVRFDIRTVWNEVLARLDTSEVLYERDGAAVHGTWTNDPRFSLIVQDHRANALLLSLAASLAPRLATGVVAALIRSLSPGPDAPAHAPRIIESPWTESRIARRVRDDEAYSTWLSKLVCNADLGVRSIEHYEESAHPTLFSLRIPDQNEVNERGDGTETKLRLMHASEQGAASLPFRDESAGTRRLIDLSPIAYDVVNSEPPITAFVDELDASLHPMLFEAMVRAVNEPAEPHRGGQLVFTAHETIIIDGEAREAAMRRDQIYYTTKGSDGAATLFSQVEFKERHNVNLRRRYLQGRYGAIPALGGE